MYNYGRCEVCNNLLEGKNIQQDFWIKDKLIVIENVPAGVCLQCGEKVVTAETGEHIAELLKDNKRIKKAPTIPVPLIKYENVSAQLALLERQGVYLTSKEAKQHLSKL